MNREMRKYKLEHAKEKFAEFFEEKNNGFTLNAFQEGISNKIIEAVLYEETELNIIVRNCQRRKGLSTVVSALCNFMSEHGDMIMGKRFKDFKVGHHGSQLAVLDLDESVVQLHPPYESSHLDLLIVTEAMTVSDRDLYCHITPCVGGRVGLLVLIS